MTVPARRWRKDPLWFLSHRRSRALVYDDGVLILGRVNTDTRDEAAGDRHGWRGEVYQPRLRCVAENASRAEAKQAVENALAEWKYPQQ